jgi:hypothetical protein
MQAKFKNLIVFALVFSLVAVSLPVLPIGNSVVRGQADVNKTPRKHAKTPATAAVPLIVHLLDRYARAVADATPLDRAVARSLSKIQDSRKSAARAVALFEKISQAQRQSFFGDVADAAVGRLLEPKAMRDVFERALRSGTPSRASLKVPPLQDPPKTLNGKASQTEEASGDTGARSPDQDLQIPLQNGNGSSLPRFAMRNSGGSAPVSLLPASFSRAYAATPMQEPLQIRYMGLYCREETDWDQSSASDEIYVVTNVIDVETREILPTKHPYSSDTYVELDTGNLRDGPVVNIWSGRERDLSVVVTVMENDFGNPDEFRGVITAVVGVAVAVVAFFFPAIVAIAEAIAPLLIEAINWLLDSADDQISTENIYLPRDVLVALSRQPLQERRSGRRRVNYQFFSRHRGGGADYYALFQIINPNPEVRPDPIPVPVGSPDLIISRIQLTSERISTLEAGFGVPVLIEITNRGTAPAGIFKTTVDFGPVGSGILVPFSVAGQRDLTAPFTNTSLSAGRSIAFSGVVTVPFRERGRTVLLRAFADSCAGEEFARDTCLVRESNERNNQSAPVSVTMPR